MEKFQEEQNINEIAEAISLADKKEFSKFADKVRTSLEDKLRNNIKIKSAAAEIKNFDDMKNKFSKIKTVEPAKDDKFSDNLIKTASDTPSTPEPASD